MYVGNSYCSSQLFANKKKIVSDQVRYMIDEETGRRIALRDRSSFMFIPNRYWTWIYVIGFILVSVLFIKK